MADSTALDTRDRRPRKNVYLGDPLAGPPPSEVAEIISRHVGKKDALISLLQDVQARYGYLPEKPLRYAARDMGIPLARLYGVATFYNQFRFVPQGKYLIRVCRGTACHVSRSPLILDALQEYLGISEDQTTPDGLFTLQTVACMGSCSLAPVITVDDRTYGRMTPAAAVEVLEGVRQQTLAAQEVAR